jgi:hypothetical protein
VTLHLLPFDQANGITGDAECEEVIVLGNSFSDYLDNGTGALIEGFHRGQSRAVILPLGLSQNAFGASLVDIEPKDLTAEFALHDNAVRPDGGLLGA